MRLIELALLALIATASTASAEFKIRIWVVEQNSAATTAASGKYPSQYGKAIFNLYRNGRVTPAACTQAIAVFSDPSSQRRITVPVTLVRGYGEVRFTPEQVARIKAAPNPIVSISVPRVPEILFLPERPADQECCYDRMVSAPSNAALRRENELKFWANQDKWFGMTLIVPPGSCKTAPPQRVSPRRSQPAPPVRLHKKEVRL